MVQAVLLMSIAIIMVIAAGAAALSGQIVYRFLRRSLYRRPLTTEELWAETSQEAMSEEEWASVICSKTPPVD